jgi:poly(3-hydroxybutyrate) depolymerase
MLDEVLQAAVRAHPRTCILAAPSNSPRCWWTHVPTAVKTASSARVPLVIDLHGGGGCAGGQLASSGFKALADDLGADAFIIAWPQGAGNGLWASCGSNPVACLEGGKDMATWDDLQFLDRMIASIAGSEPRVDVERVYVSGFSLGCMLAQRYAMERSKVVAGLGCHGGELSGVGTTAPAELEALKQRFDIQPMPVYSTIGDQDAWLELADPDWRAWAYWNGCLLVDTRRAVALGSGGPTSGVEHVGSNCTTYSPALETVLLVIADGGHTWDARMARRQWDFLKLYRRTGAAAELPQPASEVDPRQPSGSSQAQGNVDHSGVAGNELSKRTTVMHLGLVVLAVVLSSVV